MISEALKKAGDTFKKDMLNLKGMIEKLPSSEKAEMQEIEKSLMECYQKGDIEGLNKTIERCHKILLGQQ
jgi:hypothetical protein